MTYSIYKLNLIINSQESTAARATVDAARLEFLLQSQSTQDFGRSVIVLTGL
jgi:hypothetical protein